MILKVVKKTKETVFSQILRQIIEMINDGSLVSGSRLPSTRELAKSTGVNRTTVIRVYEELWSQGYTESCPGSYTTVRNRKPIVFIQSDNELKLSQKDNIFHDNLDLQYDLMMYYLENGKKIEAGKINFLQLAPDTRLLNPQQVKLCMNDAMNEKDANPFDFTHARGYPPLRNEIIKHLKQSNIFVSDHNILVTNSSLQALQLIFQVFSKPGDFIAVESPSFSIIHHFAKVFKLNTIEIPITQNGMDLRSLEEALKTYPLRFVYTMPTCQNPTGISMPQDKREELLRICVDYDCMIIEDSIEEEMKFSGKTFLPLKAIDHKGQVIYLGNFAKVLAPGLRTGWIIASPEFIKKLTVLKSILEISSVTLNQMHIYHFFRRGFFELQLRKTTRVFRKRMKTALDALKKYIPSSKAEWNEPDGGYMIWMKLLTKPIENIEFHIANHGVMVHNGKYFFLNEPKSNYIRICIAQTDEFEIEEGIRRLGKAIEVL